MSSLSPAVAAAVDDLELAARVVVEGLRALTRTDAPVRTKYRAQLAGLFAVVLGVMFVAYVFNFVDRQIIGVLAHETGHIAGGHLAKLRARLLDGGGAEGCDLGARDFDRPARRRRHARCSRAAPRPSPAP